MPTRGHIVSPKRPEWTELTVVTTEENMIEESEKRQDKTRASQCRTHVKNIMWGAKTAAGQVCEGKTRMLSDRRETDRTDGRTEGQMDRET